MKIFCKIFIFSIYGRKKSCASENIGIMFILKERRIDLVLFSENKMFAKMVQPFFFFREVVSRFRTLVRSIKKKLRKLHSDEQIQLKFCSVEEKET